MTTIDERIEAQLRLGHPEADGYAPPAFGAVLGRPAIVVGRPIRGWAGPLAVAAAVVVVVAGFAWVNASRSTPAPGVAASASAATPSGPAGTASPSMTPSDSAGRTATMDPIATIRAALTASGVAIADGGETTTSAPYFSCGVNIPMRTFVFNRAAQAKTPGYSGAAPDPPFEPSPLPPITAFVFASGSERASYQGHIGGGGDQFLGKGCTAIIDFVAQPHWVGGGPYLLLVVTNDNTLAAKVAAAARLLGAP